VRSLLLEYQKIEVILIEGDGGVFEISKSDKTVFSKKLSGRFPTETEVRAMGKEV
jgi:selT/selW/selH-like putative selenoprotein